MSGYLKGFDETKQMPFWVTDGRLLQNIIKYGIK